MSDKNRAAPHKLWRTVVLGMAGLGILSALALVGGNIQSAGSPRLVSIQPLPTADGEACQWLPASANQQLWAALQGRAEAKGASFPGEAERESVRKRRPLRIIKDQRATYSGIAVDPTHNEVVMADENNFGLMVYDRLENTPPTAAMSEPKRIIKGSKYLEFVCSTYVDPVSGDIYAVNNDTVDYLTIFDRSAKGAAEPNRKLATPHTTFGIAVDEQAREIFFTIQDDHAVVVFDKLAKEDDPPLRTIQGNLTQMADPHGIALDSKTGLIFVSNWGSSNERKIDGTKPEKPNWPIGRAEIIPGSGKLWPPSITVYRKDAKGDVAPLRVIQGPKTQLDWPTALVLHAERGELFVANDTGDSVVVFRTDANGDAAPIRVIKGPKSLVKNPVGISLDLKNNELWVANFGNHSATVYKIDANGDAPPIRVIRSAPLDEPAPMFSNPHNLSFDSKRKEILVSN